MDLFQTKIDSLSFDLWDLILRLDIRMVDVSTLMENQADSMHNEQNDKINYEKKQEDGSKGRKMKV